METKRFDVVALGELLIDFTENGLSGQGNALFEANPGGAPCNSQKNEGQAVLRSAPRFGQLHDHI